ncbi:glycosyltransferase family 4 protein [Cellulophaga sp. HaHaR_3_176]|uniref:glycosyltransferase family 4 protein n=1 Tax=Cellulophaga sp. HaHaR_3_176 TaxID=1942464 RepID=UPI001C1F6077|nr:glycosyltransferase family 4 protein [Cellulophaga sp. HaHaR_3_176]QWX85431.1 glycosyltransferase family 4 protein [Cellulophaga sp. HaHaR_3_176]
MKKVLIITYYWPPAGGPGVQRWLKFVKYLRDFGIEPIVYIPENPNYPIVDANFLNEIPEGITIFKQPIFEPYKIASLLSSKKTKRISSGIIQTKNQSFAEKMMLWVRGNLFIPDARKYWVKPSVTYLKEIIKKEEINTVITTGPPHSVHLIGLKLKEQLNIKWISDFRDPWTSIGYHKKLKLTSKSIKKHKKLESLVLNTADKIVVTSETTKKEFQALSNKTIEVITNGFDTAYAGDAVLDDKFTIAHIGSLLTGRNPENLWQVLSELINENSAFKQAVVLNFVGVVSDDVLETINSYGLKGNINLLGYVSHSKAIEVQRSSQILLLAEIDVDETRGIIPGKLFEYMAAKRPIIAIGPENWDVAKIISETSSGETFTYQQKAELKKVILSWFTAYQQGKLNINSSNINKYSRRELTKKLAEQL